ncbi:MAG TPA: flavin reductase family protein [Actinomycetota bacterium]|nr:flavin reductase family protein [Actinomycetota bacterium]
MTVSIDRGVDPQRMRNAMSAFSTGVAVVATETPDGLFGMTVNSLTSVSLDPPLLLVCLKNDARTTSAIAERGEFTVSVLGQRQDAIADRFAKRGEDRFGGLELFRTEGGLPYIPKALAVAECRVDRSFPAGDHEIVLASVHGCEVRDGAPLVFFRSRYHDVTDRGRPADWYW